MSDKSKFKVGDKVRCMKATDFDSSVGVKYGAVGVVEVVENVPFVRFEGTNITGSYGNNRNGAWAMYDYQLELVPFEIPASPFYVRTKLAGVEFKIDVVGLCYTATDIKTGSVYGPGALHLTRNIPAAFNEGHWTLIDPPAPAVDPVVALTARVQKLLREQAEAYGIVDAAHNALNAAQEKQRDIGKLLKEAQRALDKSIHEAAGVKWDSIRNGPIREIAEILDDVR